MYVYIGNQNLTELIAKKVPGYLQLEYVTAINDAYKSNPFTIGSYIHLCDWLNLFLASIFNFP